MSGRTGDREAGVSGAGFSLKDDLFNPETVGWLAAQVSAAVPGFQATRFKATVLERFPELELKARINWIAEVLDAMLPEGAAGAEALVAALPPPLDPTLTDDDFGQFIIAPFGVVVERRYADDPSVALDLLEEITQRFSMEFSIRPFLNTHPDLVLGRLEAWTAHPNYHVRRLVSEGTRPRLPWGAGITLGPARALPLLDALHMDSTRYVTRSVANHLNDVTRKAPDLVIARLRGWQAQGAQSTDELQWMTAHALRTLTKQGHPDALELLGYLPDPQVTVNRIQLSPEAPVIDGRMEIVLSLTSPVAQRLALSYAVDFPGAGETPNTRVFKLGDYRLAAGEQVEITKRHRFKGGATTFTLRPGPCVLRLRANGAERAQVAFTLDPPT